MAADRSRKCARGAAGWVFSVAYYSEGRDAQRAAHLVLVRCVFGNPFRPVAPDPSWRSWHKGAIRKLAEGIYDNRSLPDGALDTSRLAILADALEEAGCTDRAILDHCRGPGRHVRGCWVVDLLLGKK
jgi:hypothetical protein